jgi:hypothetical protein
MNDGISSCDKREEDNIESKCSQFNISFVRGIPNESTIQRTERLWKLKKEIKRIQKRTSRANASQEEREAANKKRRKP